MWRIDRRTDRRAETRLKVGSASNRFAINLSNEMRENDESGRDVELWILQQNEESSEIVVSLKSSLEFLIL